MVGTLPEVVWVVDDEVSVADGFRVGVELGVRGMDSFGKVRGSVFRITGSVMGGRAAQESTCSRRSTGVPRRRGFGRSRVSGFCEFDCAVRECLLVVLKLFGGCWSVGGIYL